MCIPPGGRVPPLTVEQRSTNESMVREVLTFLAIGCAFQNGLESPLRGPDGVDMICQGQFEIGSKQPGPSSVGGPPPYSTGADR